MTNILNRYSDRCPQDIRDTVRGIADGGSAQFRTPVLRREQDGIREHWLQAWKNPETNLWAVDRHERLAVTDSEGRRESADGRKQSRMMSAACFFDALHACSQYAHDEKKWGGAVEVLLPEEDASGVPDYRDAAKAALQPVDKDGTAHPAAFGNILTPGDFGEEQFVLAAKTAGRELDPVPAPAIQQHFLDGLMGTKEAPQIDERAMIAHGAERSRLIRIFNELTSSAKETVQAIETVKENEFKPESWLRKNTLPYSGYDAHIHNTSRLAWGVVLTAGLKPVIGYLRGTSWYTMNRFVQKSFRKFENLMEQLPDSVPEKKLCIEFARAARATYRLEHAAMIHRKMKEGNASQHEFEKGLRLIDKAAEEGGLPPGDAAKLKSDYLDPSAGFYKEETFLKRLDCHDWNRVSEMYDSGQRQELTFAINKRIEALQTGQGIPPGPL